jgi:hypothetical protein
MICYALEATTVEMCVDNSFSRPQYSEAKGKVLNDH